MMPAMKSLLAVALLAASTVAVAAPAKKYHFELTAVTPKPEVKPDVAKIAQERVEAQFKKALDANPQLVSTLDGAPDPATKADAYRRYLAQKGISGSYLVTVEITDASEEIQPMEGKSNTQRMVVHVGIHVLGETIPDRTMGFTGDGQATVKQEIGMKVRDTDRNYAWDGAAETAVNDALKTCFTKLSLPHAKP
jgi:hypothetical protein